MEYKVYISAPTCVLELDVESESEPTFPTSGHPMDRVKLGKAEFPLQAVLGIVPKHQYKGRGVMGGPK